MNAPEDTPALPGPLHGLRVLELADENGQFCGKLMADLGADVLKIEPPGGQHTRLVGPFLDDLPHRERSLFFWHYNTSKRGLTLNLEHPDGQALFRRLVPTADIVLETFTPGYLPSLGLGYEACALTTEAAGTTYIYTGQVVQRHTGRAASVDRSEPTQFHTRDGLWVNTTRTGFNLTPARLRRLATMLDQHGLAQDLLDEKYQNPAAIQANLAHIAEVLEHFFAHVPQEDAWRSGQEHGLPWGGVRSMDEIIHDPHLHDRGFFTAVEHPELGRQFIYPGGAAIYNASPWRISRRAPLIGEHNEEIFCGELGVQKAALTLLAESGVI